MNDEDLSFDELAESQGPGSPPQGRPSGRGQTSRTEARRFLPWCAAGAPGAPGRRRHRGRRSPGLSLGHLQRQRRAGGGGISRPRQRRGDRGGRGGGYRHRHRRHAGRAGRDQDPRTVREHLLQHPRRLPHRAGHLPAEARDDLVGRTRCALGPAEPGRSSRDHPRGQAGRPDLGAAGRGRPTSPSRTSRQPRRTTPATASPRTRRSRSRATSHRAGTTSTRTPPPRTSSR